MKQNTKDWLQYISAIALIASAIAMGFLSFIVTETVGSGPLAYIGETLTAALAIFGVAAYFVNQMAQFKTDVRKELDDIRKEVKP